MQKINKEQLKEICQNMLNQAEQDEKEIVTYCGEEVELLHISNTEYGTLAFIRFEDGREDEVPVSTIKF